MRISATLAGLVCVSLFCAAVSAQEWTRFRGPNGTGYSECKTIPVEWTEEKITWKATLPGVGHASPVIWGERVFLLSADPTTATRYVICLDAKTGKQLWQRDYTSTPHRLHTRSSYASSTPTVDAEHVYVAWSSPEVTTLKALDHNGQEVWSKDLGRWVSQHGFGTSPILYKDLVILHNSQDAQQLPAGVAPGDSFMMAFDRKTGEERWRTPLKSVTVSYSVPFIYEPDNGPAELVCTSTGNGIFALDPETGAHKWAVDAFSSRTVSSPVFAAGHIFGSTGSGSYSGNYIAAVKPGQDATLSYKLANSSDVKAPYVPCLIARGDKLFLLYDRGFASCVDAATGKVLWTERMRAALSGSPILVDDRIYVADEEGFVWVVAADEKAFRVLARNPVGEASHSTPAVSGGRLFVRTFSHLVCIAGDEAKAGG